MVRDRRFEDVQLGEEASRTFAVTAELVDGFARLSGDVSPIHVDVETARARGFEERVAHGALLGALVSSVVGTELPGARGLLHAIELKFKKPCCVGRSVTVTLKVVEKIEAVRALVLDATLQDDRGTVVAQGRVQSGVAA
jgi:acyl dehydratase